MVSKIEKRKKEHIDLCVNKDVNFKNKTTLLEDVELIYKTLPEINLKDVDLSTNFLGKDFSFPFIVSAITGGAQISKKINLNIAKACDEMQIGMGLGSMRALLENEKIKDTFFVKKDYKDLFVSANLGAVQLPEYSIKQINETLNLIEADALAIHLNAAQEAMQPEGDTNFENLISYIDSISRECVVPVYVKEVGHGISGEVSEKLVATNIKAIDVQGAGTSWTRVDSLRHKKSFGTIFRDFGVPTAQSLIETKEEVQDAKKIIGSGGIRNGLDAIKAIILGADLVGNAMPILKAEQKGGFKEVSKYLQNFKKEMEITSFLIGAKNINEIKKQEVIILKNLRERLNQ
jgi:isopentenyl-diphosphate delta-isomerase